ncbi:MAG: saccharopine dehydrogenase NADP-binding domain-containing protein [Chloroflexota bacterium]|nr:saccharopine dehydrogenase NADP-binding domain-containing protein [Chloroflexota bacterium]
MSLSKATEFQNILILGGYGNTGWPIAELLLQETDYRVVVAGRNQEKAEIAAAALNSRFGGDRAATAVVDAANAESLRQAMTDVGLVVVASSTAEYVENVATAALIAGIDYCDVQYATAKLGVLQGMAERIQAEGRCFITDGGFHPGLPAALVRYIAPRFDQLDSARVGSVIKIDWSGLEFSPATMKEMLTEFLDFELLEFKEGEWRKASWWSMWKPLTMDFGPPFDRQYCVPMFLEEMRSLPERYPSLHETGFFVGGFNWFVDWIVMPVGLPLLKLSPDRMARPVGNVMEWGLRRFSRPPYGTLLKLEAEGLSAGKRQRIDLTLSHPDGYLFTAIPMVACLLQYLDRSARRPGLWLQAHIVEPERMMADMERLGIAVQMERRVAV